MERLGPLLMVNGLITVGAAPIAGSGSEQTFSLSSKASATFVRSPMAQNRGLKMIMTTRFDIRDYIQNWREWLHDLSLPEVERINRAADSYASWQKIWQTETWWKDKNHE